MANTVTRKKLRKKNKSFPLKHIKEATNKETKHILKFISAKKKYNLKIILHCFLSSEQLMCISFIILKILRYKKNTFYKNMAKSLVHLFYPINVSVFNTQVKVSLFYFFIMK